MDRGVWGLGMSRGRPKDGNFRQVAPGPLTPGGPRGGPPPDHLNSGSQNGPAIPSIDPRELRTLKEKLPEIRARWKGPWHHCRECDKWYGAEDDEYGPCMYKHLRGEARHVTPGGHECDEPQELRARGLL